MSGKLCLVHPGRDCCADDGGAVLVSDVVNICNDSAVHLLVFEKRETKKPGRSALCQFIQKNAYTSELVTHLSV